MCVVVWPHGAPLCRMYSNTHIQAIYWDAQPWAGWNVERMPKDATDARANVCATMGGCSRRWRMDACARPAQTCAWTLWAWCAVDMVCHAGDHLAMLRVAYIPPPPSLSCQAHATLGCAGAIASEAGRAQLAPSAMQRSQWKPPSVRAAIAMAS